MFSKKKFQHFEKDLGKVETWRKATQYAADGSNIVGDALILGGGVTGQPEIVALGGGILGGSKLLKKSSQLLKKTENFNKR